MCLVEPGVAMNAPLIILKRFRKVEQFQDIFANRNEGKQTLKLSPFTAALSNHDLNCRCECGSSDEMLGVAPEISASRPVMDRREELEKTNCSWPGP